MRDRDIGGLSYRGFLVSTIVFTAVSAFAFLRLSFQQAGSTGPASDAALVKELAAQSREVGMLTRRLDECSREQATASLRLSSLEKAGAACQPTPPTAQPKPKQRH